jgi:hypothetical protein
MSDMVGGLRGSSLNPSSKRREARRCHGQFPLTAGRLSSKFSHALRPRLFENDRQIALSETPRFVMSNDSV